MRSFRYILLTATLIATQASANCFICDEKVALSRAHAQCFLLSYDEIFKAIQDTSDGYLLVDLAACRSSSAGGFVWRGGIGSLPRPDIQVPERPQAPRTKSAYIFDPTTALCVKRKLETLQVIEDVVEFDLASPCDE